MRSECRNYGPLPNMDSQQTRVAKNMCGRKLYRHSQTMAGRRKRCESRELPLSCRKSRLTDVGEINKISPATSMSRTALSRDKLYVATLARHGHPSRSQGTSSSTIDRIHSARTSGFDDSIRCTSIATS